MTMTAVALCTCVWVLLLLLFLLLLLPPWPSWFAMRIRDEKNHNKLTGCLFNKRTHMHTIISRVMHLLEQWLPSWGHSLPAGGLRVSLGDTEVKWRNVLFLFKFFQKVIFLPWSCIILLLGRGAQTLFQFVKGARLKKVGNHCYRALVFNFFIENNVFST